MAPPVTETIERIGLAGRSIARRRAESVLIEEIPLDQAIELVKDASSIFSSVQDFLGPAGDLLEELLP